MKASSVKRDNSRKSWNVSCLVFPNLTEWELEAINRRANTSNMMKNDPKTIFSRFGFWGIFSMILGFEVMIFHGFGLIGIYCIWSISNSKIIEKIRQNPDFEKIVSGSFYIMLVVYALRFTSSNSQ